MVCIRVDLTYIQIRNGSKSFLKRVQPYNPLCTYTFSNMYIILKYKTMAPNEMIRLSILIKFGICVSGQIYRLIILRNFLMFNIISKNLDRNSTYNFCCVKFLFKFLTNISVTIIVLRVDLIVVIQGWICISMYF